MSCHISTNLLVGGLGSQGIQWVAILSFWGFFGLFSGAKLPLISGRVDYFIKHFYRVGYEPIVINGVVTGPYKWSCTPCKWRCATTSNWFSGQPCRVLDVFFFGFWMLFRPKNGVDSLFTPFRIGSMGLAYVPTFG